MVPEDTCVDIFHPRLRRYQSTRFHRVQRPRTIPTLPRFFSKLNSNIFSNNGFVLDPSITFNARQSLAIFLYFP